MKLTAQIQPSVGHAGRLGTSYVASLNHGVLDKKRGYRLNKRKMYFMLPTDKEL